MLLHFAEGLFRIRKLMFLILLVICIILCFMMILEEDSDIKSIHVAWLKMPPDKVLQFTFDTWKVINLLDKRFLSFSIDTSQIYRGLRNPSLRDKSLRKRVKHLGGGYLRVGGTAADMLVFSPSLRVQQERSMPPDGGLCSNEQIKCGLLFSNNHIRLFSMSAEDWHDINDFCQNVGLKLLFDLNVLLRNREAWNFSNAEYLIDYSYAYQYDIDWQLGNEPNSFPHVFGVELPPKHLSDDFKTLKSLLERYSIYNKSKIIGPDVTNPSTKAKKGPGRYLNEFLENKPDISAVSWHHYYTGPNANLSMFLNVSLYNEFKENCRQYVNITKKNTPLKPIWITETGSAYGGGVKELSDTFVASFLWIDKLGVAAREGISLVVRQSLYRASYALLNSYSLLPNPDYWVSILYKKLVGRRVLDVTCDSCGISSALRVYGHCSKKSPRIVLYGVNLDNVPLGLSLPMNVTTTALLYSLTSPSLTSRLVKLNGYELYLTFTDSLPKFRPIVITLENPVLILPHSIFFLEVDVVVPACV
uniref:Putative heparanase-like protein n=1 Tax=Rhodnius prolixus TaxID=13249 RepID=A0A4P6D6K9_RHOPR